MATVHVPYTVEQDEDGVWCAHAWLGSSGGANGNGATAEEAFADLREAVRMVIEEDGVPAQLERSLDLDVAYWWRQTCAATGCGTVRLHDLRHFYASGQFRGRLRRGDRSAGVRPQERDLTLATYAHLWPTAEDRTRAAAAAMLAETLQSADSVRTAGKA